MPIPTAAQWKTYDAKTRLSWLAKLTPEQKNTLRQSLNLPVASETASPRTEADISVLDPNYRAEKGAAKRADAVDYMLDQLPTAIGMGAQWLGGGKELPTGMLTAGAGGVLGESLRELLGKRLYSDPARKAAVTKMGAKEAAEEIGEQGALQSGAELASRGIGGAFKWLANKTGLTGAAESQIAAKAGRGVQLTPGEASGNRGIQAIEHFVGIMPGAVGPLGRFDEERAGQGIAQLGKRLDEISARGLSREESGRAVQAAVQDTMKDMQDQANALYNPLKKPLGLPATATRDEVKAAAEKAAEKGDGGAALKALHDADAANATMRRTNGAHLLEQIAKKDYAPDEVHKLIAGASTPDLRAMLARLDPATKQDVARNIMEDALGMNVKGEAFSAKSAIEKINALSKNGPKAEMIFGTKNLDTTLACLRTIEKIQKNADKAGGAFVGHRLLETVLLGMAGSGPITGAIRSGIPGAMEGAAIAGIGGLSTMGAMRILAEGITNPKFARNVLVALTRAAQVGVRAGVPMAIDAYRGATAGEPSYNDVMSAGPLGAAGGM